MIQASIIGASGYAGGELLRILLGHQKVNLRQVTSQSKIGELVSSDHPNLRGATRLIYESLGDLKKCDVLFVSLPNGISMEYMEKFQKLAKKIIDLGTDFRLNSIQDWETWYQIPHKNPALLKQFVYGLPELHRKEIQKTSYVAGPGCEATVSILTLWPLIKHKLILPEPIIIDAKMSSSQAGNKATAGSHHPERTGVVRSYAPTGHRHTGEVEQELAVGAARPKVAISATAIQMVRGLLVTIHVVPNKNVTEIDIWKAYRQEYGREPFIRIIKQKKGIYRYPEPKILQGTNFCDIGFEIDSHTKRIVLIGAIDNLTRGTAGQAVQCMNIMFHLPETTGLEFPGLHPI